MQKVLTTIPGKKSDQTALVPSNVIELMEQNESLRKDIEGLQEENKRLQNCLKDINAVLLPIDFLDFTKAETKIKNLAEKALNNITDKG